MKRTGSKESREVNSILHTLRGEQFRHSQNVRQSRTHLSAFRDYSRPTLPTRFTTLEYDSSPSTEALSTQNPVISYSGPAPPKSWRPSPERDDQENVQWRARALKLVASHLGNFMDTRVPSLALLCLQMIFAHCTNSTEFRQDVVPYIPYHLRRDAIRYCAIHSPLPNWKLYALFNPQGNADGEILIMGPTASLPEDHFFRGKYIPEEDDSTTQTPGPPPVDKDWESEDTSEEPLLSLILVSTRLSTSTVFSLPPTLTRLALINLSAPIPIHQLPKLCPLIVLLDLSFNDWLKDPTSEGVDSLEKTPWTRWKILEMLGLRECYISDGLVQKINAGRWDDVNVIKI